MILSWIFFGITGISCLCAAYTGNGSALSAAIAEGARAGITLAGSMAGSMCLWTGIGKLMHDSGITGMLSRRIAPVLNRIFPDAARDTCLRDLLCGNICANFLGLGNAATPMGIQAAKRMAADSPGTATDGMCRLVVLNTASIQLIPATVAALRAAAGCTTPFDLLPAVWITSLSSAGLGLAAAVLLGKLTAHG